MTVLWKEEKEKEISISQNGRYLEFYKRNSPLMYKYDLGSTDFFCEKRSTGERQHRSNIETNRWFSAKLITEDDKIASMFMFAKSLAGNNAGILGIMARFASDQVRRVEQWAALGTHFRKSEHAWGNRRSGVSLQVQPGDVDREIRDFIAEKTWSVAELNNFCHLFDNVEDTQIINQIFKEITDHPEYASAFVVIRDGRMTNFLYQASTLNEIVRLVNTYNLNVDRLMFYMNYLNEVEKVDVENLLMQYGFYLAAELEKHNGKKNRMFKYPNHFLSVYHAQQERIRREQELDNYVPDEHVYENEYLEYEDDEFIIKIPRCAEDVRDEGRQQQHCIATSYLDHIGDGDTVCVFMRKADSPNRSFITMEIRNGVIRQACIGNNNPVPEEYRPWIRNWAAIKGVNITNLSWRTRLVY